MEMRLVAPFFGLTSAAARICHATIWLRTARAVSAASSSLAEAFARELIVAASISVGLFDGAARFNRFAYARSFVRRKNTAGKGQR
jgi:hypothetical protein